MHRLRRALCHAQNARCVILRTARRGAREPVSAAHVVLAQRAEGDGVTDKADKDFQTDRGSGAVITAFAVLGIVALAILYMLFPFDKEDAGRDTPQAKMSQGASPPAPSAAPSSSVPVPAK